MKVYTIGFTKKSAKEFFTLLKAHDVRMVIDVRRNNRSQLAGFTKGDDLRFFLKEIGAIDYEWWEFCAPSETLLKSYQNGEVGWNEYTRTYEAEITKNKVAERIDVGKLHQACFLCSEPTPENCHRRLLAEHLRVRIKDLDIEHIT